VWIPFHDKASEFIGWLVVASPNGAAIISLARCRMTSCRLYSNYNSMAITKLKSHVTIFPPFLSDFENNDTVEFSEFFFVGWARENKYFEPQKLWGLLVPICDSLSMRLIIRKGTATASPLKIHDLCCKSDGLCRL